MAGDSLLHSARRCNIAGASNSPKGCLSAIQMDFHAAHAGLHTAHGRLVLLPTSCRQRNCRGSHRRIHMFLPETTPIRGGIGGRILTHIHIHTSWIRSSSISHPCELRLHRLCELKRLSKLPTRNMSWETATTRFLQHRDLHTLRPPGNIDHRKPPSEYKTWFLRDPQFQMHVIFICGAHGVLSSSWWFCIPF